MKSLHFLLWSAACSALMAGVLFFVYQKDFGGIKEPKQVTSTSGSRPVLGRLVGLSYAPYAFGETRTSDASFRSKFNKRLQAQGNPDASDRALLLILGGETDRAIVELEAARTERPHSVRLLIDLAALYRERAVRKHRPDDLIRSLASADQALTLSPDSPEALFNAALVIEDLGLSGTASAAWQKYLRIHRRELGWSVEALNRLKALARPSPLVRWKEVSDFLMHSELAAVSDSVEGLVRVYPQASRELVDNLLCQWAEALDKRDDKAAADHLSRAFLVSHALARTSRDILPESFVKSVEKVRSRPYGYGTGLLSAAYHNFRQGMKFYDDFSFSKSERCMLHAEAKFRRSGSLMGLWAGFFRAVCEYQKSEFKLAKSRLNTLQVEAVKYGPSAVLARVLWVKALTELTSGYPRESLSLYLEAEKLFDRLGENENRTAVENLIAENYRLLGDDGKAWEYLEKALIGSREILSDSRRSTIFAEAADASLKLGYPQVALYFREENLRMARNARDILGIATELQARSRLYKRRGDRGMALSDLAKARREISMVDDPHLRTRFAAEISLDEASLWLEADPHRALILAREAVQFFEASGRRPIAAESYLQCARAEAALALWRDEERDLEHAISIRETEKRYLSAEDLRLFYSKESRSLFETMITLQLEVRRDPRAAFLYAARRRTQKLQGVQRLKDSQFSLPPGIVMLQFEFVRNKLLEWICVGSQVRLFEPSLSRLQINRLSDTMRVSLERRNLAADSPAALLYDELIRPIGASLSNSATLVFVPDGILSMVPFAALFDAKTKRFLIEDHPVVVSPDPVEYFTEVPKGRGCLNHLDLLAIGDPAFDVIGHPGLQRLVGARTEAENISKLYGDSAHLLLGQEATRKAFLELAPRSNVIHFAGHAVFNQERPEYSYLVLSGGHGNSEPTSLYVHEISRLNLTRSPLVILSACETGAGFNSYGEERLNFARAFMAAGSRGVIVNLWQTDDGAARDTLSVFHRYLRSGISEVDSLRSAQLDMVRAGIRPDLWAGFQFWGRELDASTRKGGK